MEIKNVPVASSEQEVSSRHQANRSAWNESASSYTAGLDDAVEFLRSGQSSVHPVERRNLGDLGAWCEHAIHLQCASGKDTLSLRNLGVKRVTGVDISEQMIANAIEVSARLGVTAAWHCCDVLEVPAALNGTADLVYTGRGSICWIHDIRRWALVVARLLKPGGVLHLFDDHPMTFLFDPDAASFVLIEGADYFAHCEQVVGWPSSYIDDAKLGVPPGELQRKFVRLWTLADIFQALREAGLVVEYLGEHREEYYDPFPNLDPSLRGRLPMTFSLVARLPGDGGRGAAAHAPFIEPSRTDVS